VTLKFKIQEQYANCCEQHKSLKKESLFDGCCLKKSKKNVSNQTAKNQNDQIVMSNRSLFVTTASSSTLVANGSQLTPNNSSSRALNRMNENSNSKSCIYCVANETNSSKNPIDDYFGDLLADNREKLYNKQPYVSFQYHIIMCALIFVGIAAILFITDLRK
jgi:hypothetical protein